MLYYEPILLKRRRAGPPAGRAQLSVLYYEPILLKRGRAARGREGYRPFSALLRADPIETECLHRTVLTRWSLSVLYYEPILLKPLASSVQHSSNHSFSALLRADPIETCSGRSRWRSA